MASEIDADILQVIPDDSFVGITPQGWMRVIDDRQVVHRSDWVNWSDFISRANTVVFSVNNISHAGTRAHKWSWNGYGRGRDRRRTGVNHLGTCRCRVPSRPFPVGRAANWEPETPMPARCSHDSPARPAAHGASHGGCSVGGGAGAPGWARGTGGAGAPGWACGAGPSGAPGAGGGVRGEAQPAAGP